MAVCGLPDPQSIANDHLLVRTGHFAGNPAPDSQYFALVGKSDDEQREYCSPGQYVPDKLAKTDAPRKQGAGNQHQCTDRKNEIDILVFGQRSDFFHISIMGGPDVIR